jgi:glucoamylase
MASCRSKTGHPARAWPLLTGECAHYELAAGRETVARQLMQTMAALANEGGMLPEQTWDAPDVPARELYFGQPAGSAMPLVWAHAEYVKLCRSLREQRVFDLPPQTVQRYLVEHTSSPYTVWRFNHKSRMLPAGQILRLEVLAPAVIHWSADEWQTVHNMDTDPTGLDVYVADLPTDTFPAGAQIVFTFYWLTAARWEGVNFEVLVGEA